MVKRFTGKQKIKRKWISLDIKRGYSHVPSRPWRVLTWRQPVKLAGRTHTERLTINGKFKMAEQGQVSNFSQRKRQPHFVSTIYNAPQMFGRNVFNLYIRNIPWSSKKDAGFRRAVSGTFPRWIETFLPFCARPSRYGARSQAFSCYSESGNWPGHEAGEDTFFIARLRETRMPNLPLKRFTARSTWHGKVSTTLSQLKRRVTSLRITVFVKWVSTARTSLLEPFYYSLELRQI